MIKLYFRKPKKKFLDWLISRFVKKYIHIELRFSNGESFSSRGRNSRKKGRPKGVGFADILYSHPDRWDVYCLIDKYQTGTIENKLYSLCESFAEKKLKYDYLGAIFQVGFNWTGIENKKKYYCNEIVALMINKAVYQISMKAAVKSPLKLCEELKKVKLIKASI